MSHTEGIIERIKKLLVLSKDQGATEAEAKVAALKAQNLIAKYNIELDCLDEKDLEIQRETVGCKEVKNYIWARALAQVVADNFCCCYFRDWDNSIVFMGLEEHVIVAKNTFMFLFNVGDKLALAECRNYAKVHGHSRGVYNSFVFGFIRGVKAALESNCVALKLVVPSAVKEKYNSLSLTTESSRYSISKDDAIIAQKGYNEGLNAPNKRHIED